MFDTMTFTKVLGAFCGAFLVYLLGKWAAEGLYHVGLESHGHEEVAAIYPIAVEDDGAGEAAPEVSFEELMAAADAGKGERVFGKCKACHKVDGSNATGPHLDGVIDRGIGAVAGFGYSGALSANADGATAWTTEALYHFLESPRSYAPGTTMSFAGLNKPEDRVNVIAYLQTLSE